MSHTVRRKTALKNVEAIKAAVAKIDGAEIIGEGSHSLYSESVDGLGVRLPGWSYPVVVDVETGEVKYDNYNGHWGSTDRLQDLLQGYGVEAIKMEAAAQGAIVENVEFLANGEAVVRIEAAGAEGFGGESTDSGGFAG